jgi:hypothetical protein
VIPSPWLRGKKEASRYARLKDKQHRKLKKWMANGLKYIVIDGIEYFRTDWMDEHMMANGQANLHPVVEELIREGQQ